MTTEQKAKVFALGNKLSPQMGRHDAFIRAWVIVKAGSLVLPVRGVTFGNRQEALRRLSTYDPAQVRAFIVPEPENTADQNALKIMAGVQGGRGLFCMGYIPREAVPAVAALRSLPAVQVVGDTVKGLRLRFAV